MHRFLLVGCCWMLLLLGTPAHALERIQGGLPRSGVSIALLSGYPLAQQDPTSEPTLGLEMFNASNEPREIEIRLRRENITSTQRLQLPAREERRQFFYLPAGTRTYYAATQLSFVDLASDEATEMVAHNPPDQSATVAQLGSLGFPLNVKQPWEHLGDLSGFMPDSWRGLAGIRTIIVPLSAAQGQWRHQQLLRDWVLQGGVLLVATPAAEIDSAPPVFQKLPFALEPAIGSQVARVQRVGLGTLAYVAEEAFAEVDGSFFDRLGICNPCAWQFDPYQGAGEHEIKQWLGELGAVSFALFGVLTLFALLVGPVAWYRLVKVKRRPFLYVLVVLVSSFVFSLVVLVSDVLARGIHARGSSHSATLLDQALGVELSVEEMQVMAPTGIDTTVYARPDASVLIQQATGDPSASTLSLQADVAEVTNAIATRHPAQLVRRRLGEPQGRLEVTPQGDMLHIENHLGVDLDRLDLWYAGEHYRIEGLRAGDAREMAAGSGNGSAPALTGVFAPKLEPLLSEVSSGSFGKNRFLALSAASPHQPKLLGDGFEDNRRGSHWIGGVLP